ncbi:MAG TPA: energy transducer TonB [Tepidisphaeraceae bacterium]|nr:energy transducer TonB [Tepidisphaeraceae bacterium]
MWVRHSLSLATALSLLFHGLIVVAAVALAHRFVAARANLYVAGAEGRSDVFDAGEASALPQDSTLPHSSQAIEAEAAVDSTIEIQDDVVVSQVPARPMLEMPQGEGDIEDAGVIGFGTSGAQTSQVFLPRRSSLPATRPASSGPRPLGRGASGQNPKNGFDSRGLPIPEYPAESLRRKEAGIVLVEVEVKTDGTAGEISVINEPGFPKLVEAVQASLKQASFEPAMLDGKPVVGRLRIPFRFVLQQ